MLCYAKYMEKYLTSEQAAEYLSVSIDTIKRYVEKGELPTYKLDRALRFKVDDLDALVSRSLGVLLTRGLRARIRHVVKTTLGSTTWRVIVRFHDTTKESKPVVAFGPHHQFVEYKLYVTEEYLEDHAILPPTPEGAEKFALRFIKQRFDKTADGNGERDITRIEEDSTVCQKGRCVPNASL